MSKGNESRHFGGRHMGLQAKQKFRKFSRSAVAARRRPRQICSGDRASRSGSATPATAAAPACSYELPNTKLLPATSRARMRRRTDPGRRNRPRRGSRTYRCSWRRCRCWTGRRGRCGCRCAATALAWGLDFNRHWRTCFKVPHCRIGGLRRLICIEPEVIQCAKANCIGVLVCSKGFSAPGNRTATLINRPRRTDYTPGC